MADHDSQNRPSPYWKAPPTPETKALADIGEIAWLRIVTTNRSGAFLHWGLPKDLLLPFGEVPKSLRPHLQTGKQVLVMVFEDEQGRPTASARIDEFLSSETTDFDEGEKVSIVVEDRSDIGRRVIVNNRYWGLVHDSDIFRSLRKGDKLDGYVKALREDNKLDIALTPPGRAKVDHATQGILETLKRHGGFMPVGDKTPPEEIYALFGVSKKVFKQSIGRLFKERYLLISDEGITAVDADPKRS